MSEKLYRYTGDVLGYGGYAYFANLDGYRASCEQMGYKPDLLEANTYPTRIVYDGWLIGIGCYRVEHDGRGYYVDDTSQAELTNRVFPGWFGDALEGEHYTAEYALDGWDTDGHPVTIYYHFDLVKGDYWPESEDQLPWDDAHIVRVEVCHA